MPNTTPVMQMISRACELLSSPTLPVKIMDLSHYGFPKCFSSTAGPFGGIGGQAITTFQIDVFESAIDGRAAVFANGRFWKVIDRFAWGQEGV